MGSRAGFQAWRRGRSGLARLVAQLYADSAPPLASLVGRSDLARALVRFLLEPAVLVHRGLLAR